MSSSNLPTQTRQWTLANQPTGKATYSGSDPTFKLETKDLPSLSQNQILVQTLYFSNDPAQRGWISPPSQIDPKRLYVPPVPVGGPMRARGIAKVLASKSSDYAVDDLIQGTIGWREYAVLSTEDAALGVRKLANIPGINATQYLGALGSTGLTAWYGLVEIGGLKKGESVVVSGAAGATGSMVVQIAKHVVGASRVIGIAGSKEKCEWVEKSLGADVCLNYKDKSFEKDLAAACAEDGNGGVDVFFDNVGGSILDAMLANVKQDGRVAVCGAITGYNGEDAVPMKNWFQVISMRLQIRGFIITDFLNKGHGPPTVKKLIGAVQEGKIRLGDENETVVDTPFEEVPKTWMKLFEGGNQGKLITKIV